MERFSKIISVALVSLACGPPYGTTYQVHVSDVFSDQQQQVVISSGEMWVRSVSSYRQGRLLLRFVIDAEPSCAFDSGEICIQPHPLQDIVAIEASELDDPNSPIGVTHRGDNDWANVWVYDQKQGDALKQIVGHELGHAFGLHHDVPGTLMCANVGCQSPSPTETDVIKFWNLR